MEIKRNPFGAAAMQGCDKNGDAKVIALTNGKPRVNKHARSFRSTTLDKLFEESLLATGIAWQGCVET